MEYTGELKYIQAKISELRIKIEPFRKNPQVKFLNEYEEFVKPAMTNIFKIKINF